MESKSYETCNHMQPLFFVVLKKFFVKTGPGRKHRRSVMPWIYHNKSTNGKSLSVGFRKLDPPDRLKNVRSVILGVHPGCGGNPAKNVPGAS